MKTFRPKKFHLGDVLSITTGKLVSPRLIDGIYDILNFMTNDNLYTHQLPRVCKECAPEILRQHPKLKDVDASGCNSETWKVWMQEQIEKYGEELSIKPMRVKKHTHIDPIKELKQFGKPVVAVVAPQPHPKFNTEAN